MAILHLHSSEESEIHIDGSAWRNTLRHDVVVCETVVHTWIQCRGIVVLAGLPLGFAAECVRFGLEKERQGQAGALRRASAAAHGVFDRAHQFSLL